MSNPTQQRPAMARRPAPIGFLSPRAVELAFVAMLYLVISLLMLLSVIGTFYGIQSKVAPPLSAPWRMITDVIASPTMAGAALLVQVLLSLGQYGTRQMARYDRRWWFGYLAALGISVYYNFQAYLTPITALGVPWLIASVIIVAGDVLPEFMVIKHR